MNTEFKLTTIKHQSVL